jgi:hypothetical protein
VSIERLLCSALNARGAWHREMARLPGSVVDDNRTVVHEIHVDEPDTSEAVVRALLATERCPRTRDDSGRSE